MTLRFNPEAFTAEARRNWDLAAPHYARLSARLFAPVTRAFLDFCGLKAGERVLDAACGPGTLTMPVARQVGRQGRVLGTDLSDGMLRLARKKARGQDNVSFRRMNAEALPLTDASFDAVTCQLGLMLFARPRKALRSFRRVLRPNGRVCCLVQGRGDRMLLTGLLMRAMARHCPQIRVPGAPTLYAFGPPGALTLALTQAGLRPTAHERLSGTFPFASPQAYWRTMMKAAGRTGSLFKSLPKPTQRIIRHDVLRSASRLKSRGRIRVPYEFVMARAVKPG